jgi:hypothetical protein
VSRPTPIDDDAMILVPALPPGKGSQPMKRTRNGGLRKRCECPRKVWPKCPHSWFLNFKPKGGPHYRLSLDQELDRHIDSKTEAIAEAERIRTAIRNGTFPKTPDPDPIVAECSLTFRAFAALWTEQRGSQLVRPRDNEYRLNAINAFVLSARNGHTFEDLALDQIRTGDIEAFRDSRKVAGLSACTVNHDLKLLRKMFN